MPLYVLLFIICSVVTLAGCQTWPPGDVEDLPPTAALPQSSVRGEVQVYYWDNISGVSVDSLTAMETYPEEPDTIETLGELRGLSERGDNYGSLVRGYIHPPASGFYTFYVSGDDETELWLSRSSNPDQITRIATVPGWTKELIYDKYASQQSPSIELASGERYYFELLHKEALGGDHFSIAWEGPGFSQQIITGQAIASYAGEPTIADDAQSTEEAYRSGYTVGFLDGSEGLGFMPQYPPLDEDQDGIYDNWETLNGLNPNDPTDANSDPDDDLLIAADEFLLGTSENNPDSDEDGIPDGVEFALSLDPLDPSDAQMDLDGDGASNLEEFFAGTDPGDSTSVPITYARGFVGQYFDGVDYQDFLVAQNDETIQFEAGNSGFVPDQPSNYFSSRWYGEFSAPHDSGSRSYTFRIRTDDGARLSIDNTEIITAWRDQGPTNYTATVSFDAGETVPFLLEHYEKAYTAVAQLFITDDITGAELIIGDVVRAPNLANHSAIDTDSDGIPDTWELRYGLSPWVDSAAEINNSGGISNLEAFNSSLHPWTLEPVASPESPAVDDDQTTSPSTTEPAGYSVTLSWTAPLTRIDGRSIALSEIQSYEILYGNASDTLANTITVDGSETSAVVTGLEAGTWYFAIRVTDTNGLTSENSAVISRTVP